jgi:hypothetical protein
MTSNLDSANIRQIEELKIAQEPCDWNGEGWQIC